jgi:hypothetical protein
MKKINTGVNLDRLGVVMAMTMLAFSLTRIVPVSADPQSLIIFGIKISLTLNLRTLISLITALLAAVGCDWLVRSHPNFSENQAKGLLGFQHTIAPVFLAFVISVTLNQTLADKYWWTVFALGGVLLSLILIAEFAIIDNQSHDHPLASMAVVALTFTLFLILSIATRSLGTRLYLEVIICLISSAMVSTRTFFIRLKGQFPVIWILIVSLIMAQLTAGLHYIGLEPIQYGLLLTGILYAMVSLVCGVVKKKERFALFLEPFAMITILVIIIFSL